MSNKELTDAELQAILDSIDDMPETMTTRGLKVSDWSRNSTKGNEQRKANGKTLAAKNATDTRQQEKYLSALRAACASTAGRAKNQKAQKLAWSNPILVEKQVKKQKEVWSNTALLSKHSDVMKIAMNKPEIKTKIATRTSEAMQRPEVKAKMCKPKSRSVCPHCGKEGGTGIMKRWHFDNCKHKQGCS